MVPKVARNPQGTYLVHSDSQATYWSARAAQKLVLSSMGKDPMAFSLHSAKIGGVVALCEALFDWKSIQVRVGWKPNIPMPQHYAKKNTKQLLKMDNKHCKLY